MLQCGQKPIGDALTWAIGVELVAPETDWTTITHEITPNPDNRALYDTWRELYTATKDLMHALGELGG